MVCGGHPLHGGKGIVVWKLACICMGHQKLYNSDPFPTTRLLPPEVSTASENSATSWELHVLNIWLWKTVHIQSLQIV